MENCEHYCAICGKLIEMLHGGYAELMTVRRGNYHTKDYNFHYECAVHMLELAQYEHARDVEVGGKED